LLPGALEKGETISGLISVLPTGIAPSTQAGDGIRVTIDGNIIIERFQAGGSYNEELVSAPINFVGGTDSLIVIEYLEDQGNAAVSLSWSHESIPKEFIPQRYDPLTGGVAGLNKSNTTAGLTRTSDVYVSEGNNRYFVTTASFQGQSPDESPYRGIVSAKLTRDGVDYPLTMLSRRRGKTTLYKSEIWGIVNPPLGPGQVSVTFDPTMADPGDATMNFLTLYGVDQVNPVASGVGRSQNKTLGITSQDYEFMSVASGFGGDPNKGIVTVGTFDSQNNTNFASFDRFTRPEDNAKALSNQDGNVNFGAVLGISRGNPNSTPFDTSTVWDFSSNEVVDYALAGAVFNYINVNETPAVTPPPTPTPPSPTPIPVTPRPSPTISPTSPPTPSPTPPAFSGDKNGDGVVNQADLDLWTQEYAQNCVETGLVLTPQCILLGMEYPPIIQNLTP